MDPLAAKMSKSDPDSGVFIHDSPADIERKIKKAFCPPEVEDNPILEIAKLIIFPRTGSLTIQRPEKFGGPVAFGSYEELKARYLEGKLHPMDLKNGVAQALIEVLRPTREFFEKHPENLEKMRRLLGLA